MYHCKHCQTFWFEDFYNNGYPFKYLLVEDMYSYKNHLLVINLN